MATNRRKWWRQPWVWIIAIPVVIVAALTGSFQPHPTATSAADHSASITVTSATTSPATATTTTTAVVPTTTTAPPPPPPSSTTMHTRTVAAPRTAPPVAPAPAPPAPAPPVTPAPPVAAALCGAPSNPFGYNYCGRGSLIVAPNPETCSYFPCIGNWSNGKGYMEECQDGDVSMSGGRQGSCSYHGGDERAVYQG